MVRLIRLGSTALAVEWLAATLDVRPIARVQLRAETTAATAVRVLRGEFTPDAQLYV